MGIYKVKGKKGESWGIDFYDNGRRIKKIIGSKQDAEHALHLLKTDSLRGELQMIRKGDMRFQELCEKYLEYGETNGKRSLERDEYSIKALMSRFEHLRITQINPLMIEDYKKKRQDEKKKSATINRELSCLRHMFNLARKWKIIRESPMDDVKLLKEGKYKMRIVDKVEADLLIDAAADHLKPILIVALNTGMRRGEVLGLRWSDIDFVNYNIHVKNTKSGRDRDVPMNELVAATFKKQDMSCEWIFPHPQGKDRAIKDVTHSFKTACKKCGIEKLRFHDLRHTAATLMVQAGVDLVTIKEILGHSTVQMTMVYCHSSQESKRKAVQKLEEIFSIPSIVQNFMVRNRVEKPKKDGPAPL